MGCFLYYIGWYNKIRKSNDVGDILICMQKIIDLINLKQEGSYGILKKNGINLIKKESKTCFMILFACLII